MALEPRKDKKKKNKNNKVAAGPLYSTDGVPYDYIVIIDAGSKGSRVFIYNWLNPTAALKHGVDLNGLPSERLRLIKRLASDSDDLSDNEDSDDEEEDKKHDKQAKEQVLLPKVSSGKKWHKKITPGISAFKSSPSKVGKYHLSPLLARAAKIVPKSQHYRTPIFLHATAGMRLLTPTEQQQILNNICKYFQYNSDFYIPDCASHVNVIDGDFEGLYGWLSINSLIGSFDNPKMHQHGKNHSTYGLLDMGGASTQVVFQPNSTEIADHQNNLYHIKLNQVPKRLGNMNSTYVPPKSLDFDVYSDSFLGFGMYQAHSRYLHSLVDRSNKENNIPWGYKNRSPINDPCLPKGYTASETIADYSYDFIGISDFQQCLTSIFPVLQNSTHGGVTSPSGNCKQFSAANEVSSCLLNDLIPAFDFDINHFIGVSGYWNTIEELLSTRVKRSSDNKDQKSSYNYQLIFDETEKVCSEPWSTLLELNQKRKNQMSEDELSELCFKTSWILNFLHLGLGFPRFGIDEIPNKNNKGFESLQMVEELGGNAFSWTLGRAILYANDEYVQSYNNFTNSTALKRPGFFHSSSEYVYQFGAEQHAVPPRPVFVAPRDSESKYHHFDYEDQIDKGNGSKNSHIWYTFFIFLGLLLVIGWLLGSTGRRVVVTKVKNGIQSLIRYTPGYNKAKYVSVGSSDDLETGFELDDLNNNKSGSNQHFIIDSEDELNEEET
ncbi:Golgi apyrase [Spathaspora sp. JA1]|nr:Golgi apyrase [Spathaspora sp. JA1]